MSTADLNALLAQVVRAAGESRCDVCQGAGGERVPVEHDGEIVAVNDEGCSKCNAAGRPPLAQAVLRGMTEACPGYAYNDDAGPGDRATVVGRRAHDDCCNKTLRVPLVIPASWPERWANDAVGGGLRAFPEQSRERSH